MIFRQEGRLAGAMQTPASNLFFGIEFRAEFAG